MDQLFGNGHSSPDELFAVVLGDPIFKNSNLPTKPMLVLSSEVGSPLQYSYDGKDWKYLELKQSSRLPKGCLVWALLVNVYTQVLLFFLFKILIYL